MSPTSLAEIILSALRLGDLVAGRRLQGHRISVSRAIEGLALSISRGKIVLDNANSTSFASDVTRSCMLSFRDFPFCLRKSDRAELE